jgi:RNA polymerase sigma-70 factor (ECF subfamily)
VKSPVPDTRHSLIARLPDTDDVEAWDQFVSIYQPLVFRLARGRGFQDADAREIVQEVLLSVSQAVERWEPDPQRGRFRDWLFTIARNLMIRFLTRRRHRPIGTGDSRVAELLDQEPAPPPEETALFDLEYRRELFRWAADRVRTQVNERTWQAFWRTSVEARPTGDVAAELGMTSGAVHVARSRVRSRLRKVVEGFDVGESVPGSRRSETDRPT